MEELTTESAWYMWEGCRVDVVVGTTLGMLRSLGGRMAGLLVAVTLGTVQAMVVEERSQQAKW